MLLLAEDDEKIANLLLHLLKKDGYQVDHAKDGNEALLYIDSNYYEVIILDWMMPGKSGIEVLRQVRKDQYEGGVIMLTAKDTLEDKVEGLEGGADDYLSKPFEYRELLARVRSLERRSKRSLEQEEVNIGIFTINRTQKRIYCEKFDLDLSQREFQVFSLLLENKGQIITREILIDRIWGIDQEITPNNLDAFIRLLRIKLQKKAKKNVIITCRGIGYKVEV